MEKAYLFGEQKNLLGVLSDPNSSSIDKNLPIIIILNSGLVHHVGPFRMSVDISRILTPLGYRVFRFDLSGIGDSKKRAQDSMLSTERNLSDVGETIEFLKNKYTECKFITLGLCTGADLAHRSAVKYKEVIGTIMLDGYAYPTTRHYLGRYSPMYYIKRLKSILFNPERLKSFIADKKINFIQKTIIRLTTKEWMLIIGSFLKKTNIFKRWKRCLEIIKNICIFLPVELTTILIKISSTIL